MLYEVYDILITLYFSSRKLISAVEVTVTFEHTLAKRISCEIYSPYKRERGTSPSRNGKWTISKSSLCNWLGTSPKRRDYGQEIPQSQSGDPPTAP